MENRLAEMGVVGIDGGCGGGSAYPVEGMEAEVGLVVGDISVDTGGVV